MDTILRLNIDFILWYQVFDLSTVKPSEFVQYGLGCLEKHAGQGDQCAKDIREKLRVVVRIVQM